MDFWVVITIGLAGVAAGYYFARRGARGAERAGMSAQEREKEDNLEKILVLLAERSVSAGTSAGEGGRITNGDVEEMLGVSDATATRYLQELEDRGALRQVGAEGRHVYYEPRR